MGEAIGATLGFAVGIAVSPIPIAAVILMMFSARARTNSIAFMAAWIVGIGVVTTVVVFVPGLQRSDGEPSDTTGWIKLVLGLLLAVLAVRQWRNRPAPGEETPVPGWMSRIDDLRPAPAFGLGFLLSAVNPKNLVLAAAAGATIGSIELTDGETVGAVAVFTVIAALTVVVPVVGYLLAGDRLDAVLDSTKDWLIDNNTSVMAVLFLVFGVVLIGDGVEILFA